MSEVYVHEPSTSGKVVLHTSLGDLDVELWSRECPVACRNFLQLCCEGYYNGLIFHRVIKDFIVQTGDPTGTGRGGSDTAVNNGKLFDLEIHPRLKFRYRGLVGVANLTGALSAGVAGGRGCGINGNQFFITLSRCDALNNTHTLFGKVTGHSLYNLMKFGELEVDKNDRPVCPPIIKGVDVLWMPFADIQPRIELQQQQQQKKKSSSSTRREGGEEDEGNASPEEQQKIKLQKPDKKLLSFAEEEEEEEEEEEGGENAAAEGKKEQLCGEKSTTSNSSRRQGDSRSTGAGSSKKILSAHDVLEDDPLLQRSSGVEPEAAAAERGRSSAGRKADDEASSSDAEEEEERLDLCSQQRKRRRSSSSHRSSNSRYSSEGDSSRSAHSRDDDSRSSSSSRGGSTSRRRSGSSRAGRGGSSRKDGDDSGSSSTLMLVRNKLAALGALNGASSGRRQQRPAGGAAADAGGRGGEAAAVSGSRRYSEETNDSSSSIGGRSSSSSHAQQQQQRREKEGRRKVEALRLWSGGGSASRGAHADRERLQDSDLMTDREKKRQLYVLRRRDNERQRQQTETLDKLNAFTQQLRSLRERQSSSSSSSGSGGKDKSGNGSCATLRKENVAKPTYAGGEEKATKKTAEAGTLNAMLPDLDEEIDENDGSWLSGGGLRFAVDSNRAYELDEARAAASVVVYDPLRGAGDVAAKKMQQRRQQQAVGWKEGRRDIEKW